MRLISLINSALYLHEANSNVKIFRPFQPCPLYVHIFMCLIPDILDGVKGPKTLQSIKKQCKIAKTSPKLNFAKTASVIFW